MNEVKGNFWDVILTGYDAGCILTNGVVKNNGSAVMGAGIAKQAANIFDDLPLRLGRKLKADGNIVNRLMSCTHNKSGITWEMYSFPTKSNWQYNSSISLIVKSCRELMAIIDEKEYQKVLLPRPGCGNGGLDWDDVKQNISSILDDRVDIITY